MGYSSTALNNAATDETARYTYISLHTADPGTTGASEATGGSPAYARKAVTWGAPANGVSNATQVTFDVPAGTYAYFGLWSALTGGTFFAGKALTASQTLGSQGQVLVTLTLTVTGS